MFAHFVDRHDSRMIEIRHGFCLSVKAPYVFFAGQPTGQDHLDSDDPVQTELPRLVHNAHAAASDLFQQLVIAEVSNVGAHSRWLCVNGRAIQRLERQTLLHRKASGKEVKPQIVAAIIDAIFIVSSCNEDLNLSRIERYLALTLQVDPAVKMVLAVNAS